jgi:signal transduction histidine kinase
MTSRALAAGADGYLQKGLTPDAILDRVRELVTYAPEGVRLIAPKPRHVPPELISRLATEHAPLGVIVAKDDDWFSVVSANPRASALLGAALTPGMTLARAMPDLANAVQGLTLDDATDVVTGQPPRKLSLTVRRAEGLVLLYLEPPHASDHADLLRRAIATTAHEIRNPVTVLIGVADTLRDRGDALSDDQRKRLRGAVVRQARMLDSITADLLTAAQAHRGTLRVDLDRVDVKEVLDAVLEGQAGEVTVLLGEPCTVMADPLRLEQMLTNLLDNARKYGAPPVVLNVERHADSAVIRVSDCGPGVPEEFRAMLFDEFTRAGDTHARGTGLGLFVVRSLAEAQGGSVSYAVQDGGGSVFTVRLPAPD